MRQYPLFQRRHYKYLAEELVADIEIPQSTRVTIMFWLCNVLKQDNPNFSQSKFQDYIRELSRK